MTKATSPRIFVYARSAFVDQGRHAISIREQVRSARSWMDEHQAELVCVFVEQASLGLKGRTVLTSMLDLICSTEAPADTILIDLPQRICRYFPEYLGIKADLGALGIHLIAIDDLESDLLAGAGNYPAR